MYFKNLLAFNFLTNNLLTCNVTQVVLPGLSLIGHSEMVISLKLVTFHVLNNLNFLNILCYFIRFKSSMMAFDAYSKKNGGFLDISM